jgi:hypothetical protein
MITAHYLLTMSNRQNRQRNRHFEHTFGPCMLLKNMSNRQNRQNRHEFSTRARKGLGTACLFCLFCLLLIFFNGLDGPKQY